MSGTTHSYGTGEIETLVSSSANSGMLQNKTNLQQSSDSDLLDLSKLVCTLNVQCDECQMSTENDDNYAWFVVSV